MGVTTELQIILDYLSADDAMEMLEKLSRHHRHYRHLLRLMTHEVVAEEADNEVGS